MSRFYVPPANIGDKYITIEGPEAHHVTDVMRLAEGDSVVIFDGRGREFVCVIKTLDKKALTVTAEIVETEQGPAESSRKITLVQAIPKKDKMDYIAEKATELGVSRIIPVVTARTIVRPDGTSAGRKTSRWRKIAQEAAKQSGRTSVPEVTDVRSFRDVIGKAAECDLVLFACLADGTVPLKEAIAGARPRSVMVMIGPEGDFTPDEIAEARAKGCRMVSLGRRVLKSDTAGLFVLSALDYEFTA